MSENNNEALILLFYVIAGVFVISSVIRVGQDFIEEGFDTSEATSSIQKDAEEFRHQQNLMKLERKRQAANQKWEAMRAKQALKDLRR